MVEAGEFGTILSFLFYFSLLSAPNIMHELIILRFYYYLFSWFNEK